MLLSASLAETPGTTYPSEHFQKDIEDIDPTLTQSCMSYDQDTVERPSSGYIVD
jgi:hypothetical protein